MTQRRNNPNATSNYFDKLLRGIGHRGSSFTDLDRIDASERVMTQDERTGRILVQEFKREGEPVDRAQWRALRGLARISDQITVWYVVKRHDGAIGWCDVRTFLENGRTEIITVAEYQEKFRRWWNDPASTAPTVQGTDDRPLTAADLRWSIR